MLYLIRAVVMESKQIWELIFSRLSFFFVCVCVLNASGLTESSFGN